ncbi:MAG: phytanoyl-CoA dioxygenase family protein [Pseudomonadota bacterium]
MKLLYPLTAAGWVFGVFGQQKSFAANPILGSPRLNRWGLHRSRVALAERLARRRRAALAHRVPAADREAFDRDGFVIKQDYLPPEIFAAVLEEVYGRPHQAYEMRQGQTVTRMTPLNESAKPGLARAIGVVQDRGLTDLTGYVAGRGGAPIHFIQTVIAEPHRGAADPQTALHADTFHATAKFWLFLHDVGEEDGPFIFAPGSHRLTPERLEWEYEQSLTARGDARAHHSYGSFRVASDEMARFGYDTPRRIAVRANTLVVADTYGFHSRAPSDKATLRVELHGHLRRNPFVPWNGLDVQGLPGIYGRQLDIHHGIEGLRQRYLGATPLWRDVGRVAVDGPAQV